MKKIILIALTIFTLILTACGAASNSPQAGSTTTNGSLPVATQLILGVFKLDETEHAVTAEQASTLLPMWQVYQGLLNSDTAAQEEIDALVEQLQETMTTEQMQTITDMKPSQQDVMTVMQVYSAASSQSSNTVNSTNGTSSQNGGGFGQPDGGEMPIGAGGPPDGGIAGGGMPNDQAQSTTQNGNAASQIDPASLLLDPLIELLQNKAGS